VTGIVQTIVNSIRARRFQHRLFKYILDEIHAFNGNVMLYTEIHWLSRGKLYSRSESEGKGKGVLVTGHEGP
jgi:hypothetical protein